MKSLNFACMDVISALEIITISSSITEAEENKKALAAYLNNLLLNDFAALVQTLYRIDVSETKVKTLLIENPQADAGDLLAELLVQRQKEKMAVKKSFDVMDRSPEEEGW